MTEPAPISPSTPIPARRSSHVLALDGVRGTAILLVLLYHLLNTSVNAPSRTVQLLMNVRESGWVGVDLFFCLSGFLITGILFDSVHTPNFFRNFYARRFLRIFPLFYLVVFLLLLYLFLTHQAVSAELHLLGPVAVFLQNTPLYLHDGITATTTHRYTAHLWSLAVEEQFYLVWPVLVYLIRDRRRLMQLAVVLALAALLARNLLLAHGTPFDYIYRITICRQDALLLGAWLALAFRGPAADRIRRLAPLVFALAMLALLAEALLTGRFDFDTNRSIVQYGYTLIAVAGTALIALAATPGSVAERLMSWRFLRFLGKYSFGIYILDSIVEESPLSPWLFEHTRSLAAVSQALPHLIYLALVLGITIPLAMLSFHFYESPILRLKRYFSYGQQPKRASR